MFLFSFHVRGYFACDYYYYGATTAATTTTAFEEEFDKTSALFYISERDYYTIHTYALFIHSLLLLFPVSLLDS